VVDAALFAPREQAGVLEHGEVLRDRGQRHGEGPRELAHGGLGRAGEPRQNRAPRRVGQGRERRVESGRMVNHMVNYIGRQRRVKKFRVYSSRASGPETIDWRAKVFVRNTAICPRVLGWLGQ
jgi:hypothetical protein